MVNEYDHFEDILDDQGVQNNSGILESAGLRDYEGISTTIAPEGASVILNCRRCNRKKQVMLEWPELVILGENQPGVPPILPTGWSFSKNNRTAFVAMKCNSCGNETGIAVHTTPEEAQGYVQAGLKAGLIAPAVVQQIRAQVAQRRPR